MCAAFLLRPAKQVLRHCLLLHCLATMPLCIIMLFHSTFSAVRMHWAIKDVDSHRASMKPGLVAIGKWQWGNDGSRLENRIDRTGIPMQEEIYASTRWFGTDLCQSELLATGVPGSHPNIVLGMLGRMELRTPSIPKSHPKSFGQCKRNTNVDRMNS